MIDVNTIAKHSLIYKITNVLNGKIYIGQYKRNNFDKYWGSGICIKNAIKKYGKDNFKKEVIIEGNFNLYLLNDLEKHYIRLYNTKRPFGYNLTDGGEGSIGVEVSKQTREKLRNVHLGKTKPEGFGKNLSRIKNKKIYQFNLAGELINEYESGRQAAKILNLSFQTISQKCLTLESNPKKYILSYTTNITDKLEYISKYKERVYRPSKKIV